MYFGREKHILGGMGPNFLYNLILEFEDCLILFCDNSFQVEVLQIVFNVPKNRLNRKL